MLENTFPGRVCGRSSFHITRITFHITHLLLKCVFGLNLVIDILKYISISVLQVIKSEIKIEAEECEDVDVKVQYSTAL